MIRSLTLVLFEMKRKLWAVNRARAAYHRLRPLLTLPMGRADLAVPDPQEDPLVESQENQESNELNCGQVEDTDCDYTVDDSSELKGTVPADDYTDLEGTVPVDYRTTAELEDEENGLNQLEASATLAVETHTSLVEGEVRNFWRTTGKMYSTGQTSFNLT